MTWTRGTLFTSPVSVGPTVLVFVGEGTVRFRPRLETERNQLRHFGGRPELVENIRSAFVRIHPADLHRVLSPGAPGARPRGRRALRGRGAPVPRAGGGDLRARHRAAAIALVAAARPRRRAGGLSGHGAACSPTRSAGRSPRGSACSTARRRLQISLYPWREATRVQRGRLAAADVLHHDLSVRFEPDRCAPLRRGHACASASASPPPTMRLRLDESLQGGVHHARAQGGEHLFFRVRHQDSVMVSLGPLAGPRGRDRAHRALLRRAPPGPSGAGGDPGRGSALRLRARKARSRWSRCSSTRTGRRGIRRARAGDYATAVLRLDVPAGHMAVTGGTLAPPRTQGGRTRLEYRQDLPGKYITVAVGRLVEAGGAGGAAPAARLLRSAHAHARRPRSSRTRRR